MGTTGTVTTGSSVGETRGNDEGKTGPSTPTLPPTVQRLVDLVTRVLISLARHWLLIANAAVGIFVGLPILAPFMAMVGLDGPARLIYLIYRLTCHQLPQRSWFIGGPKAVYTFDEVSTFTGRSSFFSLLHHPITDPALGYQIAFCQRDVAIYLSIFLAGLAFALLRNRLRPLPLKVYALLIAPMAIDGFTQLLGLRESTWLLRTFTGSLFGMATVWMAYPYLELGMRDIYDR